MKNLIYFTVGFNPDYIELTYWCIYSLLYHGLSLENLDILIMCDQEYLKYVQEKLPSLVKIMITETNDTAVQCSMRKIEIFNYPEIDNYDKILYLDSDIIALKNISILFDTELDPNILYVKAEENATHQTMLHSLGLYTYEDGQFFTKNNIKPFCCGHFLFKNSFEIKNHFNHVINLVNLIKSQNKPYFYEQSFMNHYFNLNNLTNSEFLHKYIGMHRNESKNILEAIDISDPYIIHVCNYCMSSFNKLNFMKHWFNIIEYTKPYFIYNNLDILPSTIKLSNHSHIIKIGTLNSHIIHILFKYNPYMLYLTSENNILETFPDNYLDLIYLNNSTFGSMVMAYKKIKKNGWILGYNNYSINIDADITKFCFEHLLKINFMFNDGCVSYAIQVPKI